MEEHVPTERLYQIAANVKQQLADKEFDHLKSCGDCYNEWVRIMKLHAYTMKRINELLKKDR
jgi:hypothetical protein